MKQCRGFKSRWPVFVQSVAIKNSDNVMYRGLRDSKCIKMATPENDVPITPFFFLSFLVGGSDVSQANPWTLCNEINVGSPGHSMYRI